MSPLIHTIRHVYRTYGPPNKPLVRTAHDCETGFIPEKMTIRNLDSQNHSQVNLFENTVYHSEHHDRIELSSVQNLRVYTSY